MKERLLIIGASGHGKVVADIAIKMNIWKSIAFLDDNELLKVSLGLKVIGKTEDAFKFVEDADIFVAVGNNAIREKIQLKLEEEGASIPAMVHPNAIIGSEVELGKGTVVMAGVVINSSTKIGKGCIINTGATIDHDNVLGDYVHISPGVNLAGGVKVGMSTWIGIGSAVGNNICITSDCTIGAGAVVIKHIIESGTYVGVPVRKIK